MAKYYQYLRGENQGKVVKLDGDCNEYTLSLMGLIEITELLK